MGKEHRSEQRFGEFGKVECASLCALSGFVDDLSLGGCKIHFNNAVSLDFDTNYTLKIFPAKQNDESFLLIAHPAWKKECEGKTQIGFKLLKSPDSKKLESYVKKNHEETFSDDFATTNSILQFGDDLNLP